MARCTFCGSYDVCPSEIGGNTQCDTCGMAGLVPCGTCSACKREYGMDDGDDDEYEMDDDNGYDDEDEAFYI